MRMKCDIEIVTGFIGSGKTSFINALIEDTQVQREKILVIQCESGEQKLEERIKNNENVIIRFYDPEKPLIEEYLRYVLDIHRPHRVIIEFNGTRNINELIEVLSKKEIIRRGILTSIFYLGEAATFQLYLDNMGSILLHSLKLSNLIIINNTRFLNRSALEEIKLRIEKENPHGHILEVEDLSLLKSIVKKSNMLDKGFLKRCRIALKNSIFK